MSRVEVEGIEEAIVHAIIAERREHHACTARQLSRRIGYHNSYISEVLGKMKARGIVDFAVEIPGSIHLVGTVEAHWLDEPDSNTRALVELVTDRAPTAVGKASREVRLGINAERMQARMAAKKQARADAEAAEQREVTPRVKKAPAKKKAAVPRKGTAAS